MHEERERIQQAMKSLELEKAIQRMKKDNYKVELDQCMKYKQMKVSANHNIE